MMCLTKGLNDMSQKKIPAFLPDSRAPDPRDNGRGTPQIPAPVERPSGKGRREERGERRRKIHPATCERIYNNHEVQFMTAMDQYKRENRRPFPTWSEVLEVLHAIGYRNVAEPTRMPGLSSTMPPKVVTYNHFRPQMTPVILPCTTATKGATHDEV